MARADLLTSLVKFGISGDKARFRKVTETIIAEERAKHHTILANKLEGLLKHTKPQQKQTNKGNFALTSIHKIDNLLHEISPQKQLDDLILPQDIKRLCQELVQEQHRVDLLRSYGLEPRNRILLVGPPGNGKTSLAEALAEFLMVPMYVVRYERIIGTYLGETALRLHRLIEYACTRKCVLFFDEFETLGKERGDTHETGEIKRVVSSLLMQIDSLPSHVVVIGATNHPELLDRAAWRRFQIRMHLPEPTRARITEWFNRFRQKTGIDLGYASETLAKKLYGLNFAEIEEFASSVFRQFVLRQPEADLKNIIKCELKYWGTQLASKKQKESISQKVSEGSK